MSLPCPECGRDDGRFLMNKSLGSREHLELQAIVQAADPAGSRRKRLPGFKWPAVVVVALLAGAAWWAAGGEPDMTYMTAPVTSGDLVVTVTATGSVQPTKKVDVSSELSGTIRNVFVDYNSTVAAGQVLAELDPDKWKATVDSSRAKLMATKAKVTEAEATVGERERDVARKRKLGATLAVSMQDVDQAQAALERAVASLASARADVAAAEAELQMNETSYAKVQIRSSINGVVLKRSVDPGQTVASSLQTSVLFTIAEDLRQMELQVDVDEADVGKVAAGQQATFTVDAFPDRKFPAVIRDVRFASETVQGVVTYKAILAISNAELLLRPGMTATAEIRVMEIKNALLIPNAALRYVPPDSETTPSRPFLSRLLPGPPMRTQSRPTEDTGRNRTVWILADGSPVRTPSEIGSSDGKRTEVKGGALKIGDRVVIDTATRKR